jgi:predicted ATP-grasp superfamily ATP-dependent carboligase
VRWLVKTLKGAGGAGIHFHKSIGGGTKSTKQVYFQEYIEGLPCSAVYLGLEKAARLLGTTRQLTGEAWLNAAAFHYCGSIGPLRLEPSVREKVERIGNVLAQECQLRGLFGVDLILSDGIPWAVEVNPRYPASTEILEYALGIKAMVLHRATFDPSALKSLPVADAPGSESTFVGKAIVFAKDSVEFPRDGPWTSSVSSKSIMKMPEFADIPESKRVMKRGVPILTFFTQSATLDGCLTELKERARDLDHYLWKP